MNDLIFGNLVPSAQTLTLPSLNTGVGLATNVCPLYVAEMSANKYRGRLAGLFELGFTGGILLSYITCYFLNGARDSIAGGKYKY